MRAGTLGLSQCRRAYTPRQPTWTFELRPHRNNVRTSQYCTGCNPDARPTFVRDTSDVNAEPHPAVASELSQPDFEISHGNNRSRFSHRQAYLRG